MRFMRAGASRLSVASFLLFVDFTHGKFIDIQSRVVQADVDLVRHRYASNLDLYFLALRLS